MCGSTRIQRKNVSVRLKNGRSVTVKAEVCAACGERYYGPKAMRQLEIAGRPRAKSAA
jgi:YgiT-type zinc finger domain-containing protein